MIQKKGPILYGQKEFEGFSGFTMLYFIIVAVSGIFIFLHIVAMFNPTAANWGFHQLAFLPIIFKVCIPLLMVLLMIPSAQMMILRILEKSDINIRMQKKSTRILIFGACVICIGIIFWLLRERFFLLGDGSLVTRIIQKGLAGDVDVAIFKNEPLSGFILLKTAQMLSSLGIFISNEFPIQFTSITFGIGSVLVLTRLVKYLAESEIDRALTFLFIITSGGIQLFFGYVEVYTPLYFGLLLYFWLAIASLRGDMSVVFPVVMYGILFTLHFGALALLPTLLYLFIQNIRQGHWSRLVISTIVMCSAAMVSLWMCGFSFDTFYNVFSKSGKHLLVFGTAQDYYKAYSLFSFAHLINLGNLQGLLSPYPLLLLVALFIWKHKVQSINNQQVFLFLIAGCSLSFIVLFNSEIGMSRDWDIFAVFNVGIIVAAANWGNYCQDNLTIKRRMVVMIFGMTLLHSASFILVNADEARAIERFNTLPDQKLWSPSARTSAYEELAIFYRSRMDADNAIKYFRKFLEVDSANSRIWGSLAHVYSLTGDRSNELRYNEKAIQVGTTNPDIYLNTGIAYAAARRYDEAIIALQKALEINPELAGAYHTMGVVYLQGKDDTHEALKNFLSAIEFNSNFADAYLGAGNCYFQLKKVAEAKLYWQKYLEISPDDANAPEIRRILQSLK